MLCLSVWVVSMRRRFCLTAGFPVQNALRVRPFPDQRSDAGGWRYGGDQELPGREVHPPC